MSTLHHGDCLDVMVDMDAGSVDAIVTDPPYGLEFMGKEWDKLDGGLPQENVWKGRHGKGGGKVERDPTTAGGRHAASFGGKQQGFQRCQKCGKRKFSGSPCVCDAPEFVTEYAQRAPSASIRMQRWHEQWAIEAYRVLAPSHYLLAFGGTRTWHRLACAIEDAGFEIRDTLMWLYGSGFPKGKACLKPAWEPIILARKPGPMRELGIEECRVRGVAQMGAGSPGFGFRNHGYELGTGRQYQASGRWPANLILDEESAAMLDGQSGDRPSCLYGRGLEPEAQPYKGRLHGSGSGTTYAAVKTTSAQYADSGGASRFFYCAKASRAERNAGCEGMEERPVQSHGSVTGDGSEFVAPDGTRHSRGSSGPSRNHHPTVKPVALMRWLVKLAARPGDVVLDPFMGSGTTGVACAMEGREFIGIEKDAEYVEIARRRIAHAEGQMRLPV